MPAKEYIICKGEEFTIEWYYGSNGRSQALAYFDDLGRREKIQFLRLVELIGTVGAIRNTKQFNYEGDGIYAFKPQPDRFLCFFYTGKKIIVTNAFRKKAQKLPRQEKERALRARSDYEARVEEMRYYE